MRYFFIVFIFIHSGIYSQSTESKSVLEVKYLIKFQRDTANTNSMTEEVASLLIGDNSSLFKSTQKVIYDSLSIAEVERSMNRANGGRVVLDFSRIPSPRFKPEVFKMEDQTVIYDEVLKTGFLYPFDEKLKWTVLDETKIIGGYTCKKATTTFNKRLYTAWFAPELAFSEGPYIFKGLPGLILEVSDSNRYYSFSLMELKKAVKPLIPPSAVTTTYGKFAKVRRDFILDPVGVFESQTKFRIPAKDRDRIIKLHRSNNNFIF